MPLNVKISKNKSKAEDRKYQDYLNRVKNLNVQKAYLSSYRHVLTSDEK